MGLGRFKREVYTAIGGFAVVLGAALVYTGDWAWFAIDGGASLVAGVIAGVIAGVREERARHR